MATLNANIELGCEEIILFLEDIQNNNVIEECLNSTLDELWIQASDLVTNDQRVAEDILREVNHDHTYAAPPPPEGKQLEAPDDIPVLYTQEQLNTAVREALHEAAK